MHGCEQDVRGWVELRRVDRLSLKCLPQQFEAWARGESNALRDIGHHFHLTCIRLSEVIVDDQLLHSAFDDAPPPSLRGLADGWRGGSSAEDQAIVTEALHRLLFSSTVGCASYEQLRRRGFDPQGVDADPAPDQWEASRLAAFEERLNRFIEADEQFDGFVAALCKSYHHVQVHDSKAWPRKQSMTDPQTPPPFRVANQSALGSSGAVRPAAPAAVVGAAPPKPAFGAAGLPAEACSATVDPLRANAAPSASQTIIAVSQDVPVVPSEAKKTRATPSISEGGGWNWLAPDPSLPRPREGAWTTDVDGVFESLVDGEGVRFLGSSVRGRGHKQDALFCDDSCMFMQVGRFRIAIVSDGAGSAKFSRVGSHLACNSVRRVLEHALVAVDLSHTEIKASERQALGAAAFEDPRTREVCVAMQDAFVAANTAIEDWIKDRNSKDPISDERRYIDKVMREAGKTAERQHASGADAALCITERDLSCTLLVVAHTEVPVRYSETDVRTVALTFSCAIGDGMIAAFRKPKTDPAFRVMMMMDPDTGQYAGQTQFLSAENVVPDSLKARVRLSFLGPAEELAGFVAMSDGVADDYYDGNAGMERLYCDLVMNGLLGVDASEEEIAAEAAGCAALLERRAAQAGVELGRIESELKSVTEHAARFKLEQQRKQACRELGETALESLVVHETVFARLEPGSNPAKKAIKYAVKFLPALGLKPAEAISRPALLRAIARCGEPADGSQRNSEDAREFGELQAQRLRDWLDCYIVRGSFDDRSLVLVDFGARQ